LPIGSLTADQLRGIASIAEDRGLTDLRTTQDQNLIFLNVPDTVVAELQADLRKLGLDLPRTGDNVVACPGTSTCRLGITSSTTLGPKLDGGEHDLRVRVSGCHNGCAQPESGDIGIYGEGRRLHGKLIPHYQVYLGGDGMAGGNIGIKGPSVPSARIEEAVARIKQTYASERIDEETFFSWSRRQDAKYFHTLLADLIAVSAEDVPVVLRDHGDVADFRVLQLGGGECAGASQQKIGTLFFEAAHERNYRDALKFQRKYSEALTCAEASLTAVARALGDATGAQAEDLAGFVVQLKAIPETQSLAGELDELANIVALEEAPGDPDISAIFTRVDTWIDSAAEWCQQRDPTLVLREALRPQARRFASLVATAP
jgi:sulfite reductase (ferredoxin)